MESATAREDALRFLKAHKTGVVATVSSAGEVHASLVYYICDDHFNLYFLTLTGSRKFSALSTHPKVAFTVASADIPQTLQIEGVAIDMSHDEQAGKRKDELFELLSASATHYAPIAQIDPSETAVIWIKPHWIRWGDFTTAEYGSDRVFAEIKT